MQLIDERNRLTADDDRFLRMYRVYGTSIAMQTVWQLAHVPEPGVVERFGEALRRGPLGRAVRAPLVPGARPSWREFADAGVVSVVMQPIPSSERRRWLDQRAARPIDPVSGPVWYLDLQALDDGTAVLSLLVSHVVADGTALMSAVGAAVLDAETSAIPVAEPAPSFLGRIVSDGADAAKSIAAGVRSAAALGIHAVSGRVSGVSAPEGPVVRDAGSYTSTASVGFQEAMRQPAFAPVSALIQLDPEQVQEAARSRGGTVNSLFVAASVGILRRAGRVDANDIVRVDLPMSHRKGFTDLRSNITTGAQAAVPASLDNYRDLGPVRAACRAAFAAVSAEGSTSNLGQPLEQVLPDAVIKRAAVAATLPLCLASNLGTAPDFLAHPLGMRSTLAAGRAVADLSAESLRHMRGGIATSLTGAGGKLTFGSLSADPDHLGDVQKLTRLALEEFRDWGLDPIPW